MEKDCCISENKDIGELTIKVPIDDKFIEQLKLKINKLIKGDENKDLSYIKFVYLRFGFITTDEDNELYIKYDYRIKGFDESEYQS